MRWWFIAGVIGILLILLGLTMVIPLLVSLYYHDQAQDGFISSLGITMAAGLILVILSKKQGREDYINQKEGMTTVALAWTGISLFGALPFYFSAEFTNFIDAFFESVSGFTTTGSSVMVNIEAAVPSLLFWRSFIQWLGGMGIIVLSIAILPFLGVGGIQLYKAEVAGPNKDKLHPRIQETAKRLWAIYVLFTMLETILL